MTGRIEVTRAGSIATVVLDRPAKLNAQTKAMWQGLGETVDALSRDDTLRCMILRGAGEKAFSPGNDIAEFSTAHGDGTTIGHPQYKPCPFSKQASSATINP